MDPRQPAGPDADTSGDPLLRKARDAVARERERMRVDATRDTSARRGQGAAAGLVQRLIDRCAAVLRVLGRPVRWFASLFRGALARRIGRAFAWASFERENGAFRLDGDGRRIFSRTRLAIVGSSVVVILAILHVALSAAHFYATRFDELVYTTGKQEIEPGERYQFTGCTSLPCNTGADNGKYYTVETSLYFPTLLYPEQNVFANIPQQNAACRVKGYGLYFRGLRWLYKSAQWYQKVYDVSCRPYDEREQAAGAADSR